MNSNGMLTITVDEHGTVTAYPSTHDALRTKKGHEVVVNVSLTKHQIAEVVRAEILSKQKLAEYNSTGPQFPKRS